MSQEILSGTAVGLSSINGKKNLYRGPVKKSITKFSPVINQVVFLEKTSKLNFKYRYVLTAAHCNRVDFVRLGEWKVVDTNNFNRQECLYYDERTEKQCKDFRLEISK